MFGGPSARLAIGSGASRAQSASSTDGPSALPSAPPRMTAPSMLSASQRSNTKLRCSPSVPAAPITPPAKTARLTSRRLAASARPASSVVW